MITVNILILLAVIYLVLRWAVIPGEYLAIVGMGIKIAVGLLLGWLYFYYYGEGDTIQYQELITEFNRTNTTSFSKYLSAMLEPIPALSKQPRVAFFIKLSSPLALLAGGNYWITNVYFSLINFALVWWFFRIIQTYFPDLRLTLLISFFLIPTITLFSSGLSKDALANGLLCLCAGVLVVYHYGQTKPIHWLLALLSLLILANLKHYAAATLVLSGGLIALNKIGSKWKTSTRYAMLLVFFATGVFYVKLFHPWLRLERLPLTVYENHQQILLVSKPESIIHFTLDPTYLSLLLNAPKALVAGLFRPFFWEAHNALGYIVGLENIILLLAFCYTFWNFRRIKKNAIINSTSLFIVILAVFIPLSAPNFGAMLRYASVYKSFFALLVFIMPVHDFVSRYLSK